MNEHPWRVLFLCHSPLLTGAQRMLANFILAMDRDRIAPVVITRAPGPGVEMLEQAGIPCFEVPFSLALPLTPTPRAAAAYLERIQSSAEDLSRAMLALEPDLVLVNTGVVVQGVLAARQVGLPCAVDLRGVMGAGLLPGLDTRLLRADEATILGAADALIAHSTWTRDFVCDTYGIAPARFRIIPNGIHLPRETASPLAQSGEPRRFVMLATLEANKNVDLFLDAAALVLAQGRFADAEFHVYGQGDADQTAHIRRRMDQPPLAGQAHLHPRTADVDAVYQSAHAAVVTSHIESFSNVCVEAMCHGRPVISTRCGGPEDIIEDGKTGFLVDHDAEEMAARMTALLEDDTLARAMGQAAEQRARERYDLSKLADDYSGFLAEVCTHCWSGAQPPPPALAARLREGLVDLVGALAATMPAETAASAKSAIETAATTAARPPARARPGVRRQGVPTPAPPGHELCASPEIVRPRRYRVRPTRDGWCGLRLMFGTHQRINPCAIRIRVRPLSSPTLTMREVEMPCADLEDNMWHEIRFDPIPMANGASFELLLEPRGAFPGSAVSIYEWRRPAAATLTARVARKLRRLDAGELYAELLHDGQR